MKTIESNNRKQKSGFIIRLVSILSLFLLVLLLSAAGQASDQTYGLKVYCSSDIYPLTNNWAKEYQSAHPETFIRVESLDTEDLYQKINAGDQLIFASAASYEKMESLPQWNLPLGREIYVPVYNIDNPIAAQIEQKGVSPQTLAAMLNDPESTGWEAVANEGQHRPVNIYRLPSAPLQTCIGGYLHTDKFADAGIEVQNRQELMEAMQKDPHALTFCKLNDVLDPDKHCFKSGVKLLPIDRNANGQIDYFEDIYDDPHAFARGVWIGKYPRMLVNNIFVLGKRPPQDSDEMAFLKWVLTEGQSDLAEYGYSELIAAERQSKMAGLLEEKSSLEADSKFIGYRDVLLVILSLLLLGVLVNYIYRRVRRKKYEEEQVNARTIGVLNEKSMNIPEGLYFDKTHTWAFMEKDGSVKIGIDDFLQRVTGDFNAVKAVKAGEKVKKNEQIITLVQNGKQLSVYSPVSGTIKYINKKVMDDPSLINKATYTEGWIITVSPSNWLREIQFLKMAEKYREWLKTEFSRLRDFLAASINSKALSQNVAYQDGGEIQDHVLKECGPQVWEDFQKNFIDTSELK